MSNRTEKGTIGLLSDGVDVSLIDFTIGLLRTSPYNIYGV